MLIKLLFKHLKWQDYIAYLIIICFIVLQVWLELTMPDYTSKLAKLITTAQAGGTITYSDVWENGGMMLLCALGSMVLAILNGFIISRFSARISKSIRTSIFNKVSSFSEFEMNKFSTPSLITRTTNDVVQIQNFLSMGIQLFFKAPITAIWAICKISNTKIEWTLATVIAVIIMIILVTIIVLFSTSKFKKIQKLTDELNDKTRENVSGVRVIRAFDADKYQKEKFEVTNNNVYKNNLAVSISTGFMMPVMTLIMSGLTLSIYWIGAYLIDKETDITTKVDLIGDMTAFTSYSMQVVMAFMMLVMIFIMAPRTIVSGARIQEVLDTNPSIKDGKGEKGNENGTVEFKNVSFSYSGDDKYNISDVSFKVESGKTIAIIGPTGSGKTTLINLLTRQFDPQNGEILVDGVNIKDYKIGELNEKISVAHQKAMMLKGDVLSNISYGDETPDMEKVDKAVKVSKSDFIFEKEGLNTKVSQGGTNFSGGQKQRLSIARCLYKDSEIMVFDDTFSALDFKTDMLVRKGIKEEYRNKTVFIIAQRIGTIKNADQIIVLDDGKISAIGTHEELIKTSDLYKEIALSQLDKEEL